MDMPNAPSRRVFLRQAGGAVLGLALVPLAGCESNLVAPLVEGTAIPFLTPVEGAVGAPPFFVQYGAAASVNNWGGVPALTQASWTLRIDGLVSNPLTLTYADLEAAAGEAVTVLKTMRCIIDATSVPGLVGTATWTGVPLRLFLDRAGVDRTRTKRLRLYGHDGFTNNLKLAEVYDAAPGLAEPLLVTHMNGAPLTPEHGFPVRLLVPGKYGYKNLKWLARVEATASDAVFGSYQEVLGYVDDGDVRVVNKVTNPVRNATLPAGAVQVFGYALSGFAGIAQVEASIDGGAFAPVRLVPLNEIVVAAPEVRQTLQLLQPARFSYPFRDVWALWSFDWMATPGPHTLRVRATDRAGHTQPDRDADPTDGTNPVFEVRVAVVG